MFKRYPNVTKKSLINYKMYALFYEETIWKNVLVNIVKNHVSAGKANCKRTLALVKSKSTKPEYIFSVALKLKPAGILSYFRHN